MSIDTIMAAVRETEDQTPLAEAVVDVADPTAANVVLARAYKDEEYDERVDDLEFESQPTTDKVARRSEQVRSVARALQEAGIDYEIHGVIGEEGDPFVDLAKTIEPDLLHIQGKGRSPTGKALFGSAAQTVLLKAPCPVTYVRT